MSGSQRVSDAAFQKFEQSIGLVSQELSANLRTLANAIATVDAAWTGGAANEFKLAQSALNDDHDALRRLIDGIHEAVVLTHRASGANDSELAGSLRGIDVNGGDSGGHLSGKSGVSGLGAGTEGGITSKIDGYL